MGYYECPSSSCAPVISYSRSPQKPSVFFSVPSLFPLLLFSFDTPILSIHLLRLYLDRSAALG